MFCHVTSLYTHFDTYSLHISVSRVEVVIDLRSLARIGTSSSGPSFVKHHVVEH